MARGVFSDGEERRMLPFALGSALATASYTMIDGLGARVSGDAVAYVAWVFVADGLFFSTGMILSIFQTASPMASRPSSSSISMQPPRGDRPGHRPGSVAGGRSRRRVRGRPMRSPFPRK